MHKLIDRCLALSQITVSSILMIPLHCTIYVFYWINAFLGVLRMAVLLFDVEWSYCNHRHRRQRIKNTKAYCPFMVPATAECISHFFLQPPSISAYLSRTSLNLCNSSSPFAALKLIQITDSFIGFALAC